MPKILLVTSGKGGTGKTTVSMLLAHALCRRDRNVLLIELDSGLRGLDLLLGVSENKIVILLIINLILLIVGTFMDMAPALLIFTPIFLPVVTALGMSPVHFGIMMIMNLAIGTITPPVGSVLFVGCSVAHLPVEDVMKHLIPYFVAIVAGLMLVTFIPALSMWLPGVLNLL